MIGLIGGTGLGEALIGESRGKDVQVETPFGPPSSPVRVVEWHGQELAIIARHGPGHTIPPSRVPFRANIFALKSLGARQVLASGAVGSLREHIHPRHLVVVDQVIDRTHLRPSTFFDDGLAVHVEFAHPFCGRLRERILAVARGEGASSRPSAATAPPARVVDTVVHERGTYVCMEGPAFSTVAESNMHRLWGGDLIGMTAMPEAKLAREAEMCYALIALPTDYDCWRPHEPGVSPQALLTEIIGHLKAATANAIALLRAVIEDVAARPLDPCPCHAALELGIWSDKARVDRELVRRLGPLLAKYFPS